MHDIGMKMRFDAKCPRCRTTVRFGTRAMRMYGGHWHLECWASYRKHREVMRGKP